MRKKKLSASEAREMLFIFGSIYMWERAMAELKRRKKRKKKSHA